MNNIIKKIAEELQLSTRSVENTLQLLEEGCTIPFIARYRKERTGTLDEVQIAAISDLNEKLTELEKRKDTIIKTISEQGKLTPELENVKTRRHSKTSTFPTSQNAGQKRK